MLACLVHAPSRCPCATSNPCPSSLPPMQIMLGVDRLDMVKGIPQKLLAYEKFLEENPQWRDKVGWIRVVAHVIHYIPSTWGSLLVN